MVGWVWQAWRSRLVDGSMGIWIHAKDEDEAVILDRKASGREGRGAGANEKIAECLLGEG